MLPSSSGAQVRRVIDRSDARIPEHAHEWPMLSIFVIGSYWNATELDEQFICVPSIVYYRAGAAHRNSIAAHGFEQLEIEFDPRWLGPALLPDAPVRRWMWGSTPQDAQRLLRACQPERADIELRKALQAFFADERRRAHSAPLPWMHSVVHGLRHDPAVKVSELAKQVNRHPAWIGSAYRHSSGETLQETAARFRVERAARLLRETEQPCAAVAIDAGFCDQSHMNRSFRRVLGRPPTAVREDRRGFRGL